MKLKLKGQLLVKKYIADWNENTCKVCQRLFRRPSELVYVSHHATPEFRGSQIRPRQIILLDGLFHGMQQGLLFIFLGKGKGSLWQIIIYVVFLIGRGLLFVSYLRQKKGTYSQPEHWKTAIGDRSWM